MKVERQKKQHQIGVKLDSDTYSRLADACEFQFHRDGQLARILIEWALPYYEQARSVDALRAVKPALQSRRVSQELQEAMATALTTIIERAPSAVVEEVARLLTSRAGKYGEEKK